MVFEKSGQIYHHCHDEPCVQAVAVKKIWGQMMKLNLLSETLCNILFVVVKLVITGVGNPDSGYWISCGGGNMLVIQILLLLREVS